MEMRRLEKSSQSVINQKQTLKNHFHTVYFTGLNCFFFIFPKEGPNLFLETCQLPLLGSQQFIFAS